MNIRTFLLAKNLGGFLTGRITPYKTELSVLTFRSENVAPVIENVWTGPIGNTQLTLLTSTDPQIDARHHSTERDLANG